MEERALRELFAGAADTVLFREPLARHTTWRIGGPADVLAIPGSVGQAQAAVKAAAENGVPWFAIGRGSNLLVRDGGIRGLVIKFGDALAALRVEDGALTALAGRALVSAVNISIQRGLSGLEFAYGIPGTVGGAVTMNAGAHGGEIRDVLERARVLTEGGDLLELAGADLAFAYRRSAVGERRWIVTEATFRLRPGDAGEMRERVRAWSRRRQSTQPLSLPNCGSVFRNPPGDHAARLIEAAGLKGLRCGRAEISELHANFIVNLGGASARDVLALIGRAQADVCERFGVRLTPEVRVVGEDEARG